MRSVLELLELFRDLRTEAVLGTVVDVHGASYRRPGARMLIRADGTRTGLVSGGCLEKDVARNAFEWTKEGARVVLYDTRGDSLHPGGAYGTGCDGLVHLLLQRIGPDDEPLRTFRRCHAEERDTVVFTVYDAPDAPELVGRVVTADEVEPGWLLEAFGPASADARSWSSPRSVSVATECGRVTALVEPVRPPHRLVVFGAGDDAIPLVRLARELGWRVAVADRWPVLAHGSRFPGADVVCDRTEVLVEELDRRGLLRPSASVVVMTHSLTDDTKLLPVLLARDLDWLGLLGPRSRTARVVEQMAARGTLPAPTAFERLQTPVGLDLGGDDPAEVALSIVAAIVAHRRGRQGGLLARTDRPIHDPHVRIESS